MIMYFVYSKGYEQVLRDENVPILVSYATTLHGNFKLPKGFPSYFIDCGAFSAASGSVQSISVQAYSLWLELLFREIGDKKNVVYCNLDVIGDAKKTLENQQYMESQGLSPLPVWHEEEPEDYLSEYCQKYDYICIGGIVGSGTSKPRIKKLTEWLLQKYPKIKFHFFGIGITAASVFRSFRPYSVDFSTWSVPARFGHTVIAGDNSTLKEVKMDDESREKMKLEEFSSQEIRLIIQRIKKFNEEIESIHDPHQGFLL